LAVSSAIFDKVLKIKKLFKTDGYVFLVVILHSFTKSLALFLKRLVVLPLRGITGRRSKPKRERQTSSMK